MQDCPQDGQIAAGKCKHCACGWCWVRISHEAEEHEDSICADQGRSSGHGKSQCVHGGERAMDAVKPNNGEKIQRECQSCSFAAYERRRDGGHGRVTAGGQAVIRYSSASCGLSCTRRSSRALKTRSSSSMVFSNQICAWEDRGCTNNPRHVPARLVYSSPAS